MAKARLLFLLTGLIAGALLAATATAQEPLPTLPTQEGGWNGGDAAYNRVLPNGQRLWVFGDSFTGPVEEGRRMPGGTMVRNAVGVEDEEGNVEYFIGSGEQGVFHNKHKAEWYWPGDFVLIDGEAWFFLKRMRKTLDGDVFGFKVVGVDIARVKNPQDPPRKWHPHILPLPYNGLTLGVAATVHDGYVYSLATTEGPGHPLYAARIAVDKLKAEKPEPAYFDVQIDGWVPGKPVVPVMMQGAAEGSLAFDEAAGRWRFIYSASGFSPHIVRRESGSLTLGWSKPHILFSCPEMQRNDQYFCYAGKEVYGKSPLTATYSVNSFNFEDLEADAGIYVPRLVPFLKP